ncbi:MAG: hypothetical protein N3G22_00575 [Candidatus Micrarchaeota archaeon]|nr:hypothetical protein [Candidatus Micrarchaeota archaeon]
MKAKEARKRCDAVLISPTYLQIEARVNGLQKKFFSARTVEGKERILKAFKEEVEKIKRDFPTPYRYLDSWIEKITDEMEANIFVVKMKNALHP